MKRLVILAVGIAFLSFPTLTAQTPQAAAPVVTGDRSTPLRPLAGSGNVGVSNAVLRDQSDIRTIRVVVEPGGKRELHSHTDVKFHLFVPISAAMVVDLDGSQSVDVPAWHPYYMKAGTQHGFHNTGTSAVEIMEIFVK
jgi:mannose-6-phosphate isomerase-like protein (cupin superfamily)